MTFLSPARLWVLALLGAVVLVYVVRQLRSHRYVVMLPTLELVESVGVVRPTWRRHAVAAVFTLALASTVVAFARPSRPVQVPQRLATIVIALDTSRSMQATDVKPQRLIAARRAATDFVLSLPDHVRVGLVTFSANAAIRVSPTDDHEQVANALKALATGDGTAVGEAVFKSLDAIQQTVVKGVTTPGGATAPTATYRGLPPSGIVVLSDGETTAGRSETAATDAAKKAKVRVSTIAYGTPNGTVDVNGREVSSPVHRSTLRRIADATGGSFSVAASADELHDVYEQLGSRLGYREEHREVGSWFFAAACALALLAVVASFAWASKVP